MRSHSMIWVVNTNSNICRIYDYQKTPAQLTLVKEINHPENKLKKSDYLTSDKPGRYQSSATGAAGAYSPHTDPKAAAIDQFSREIANELDHGRKTNAYKQLIIITQPHMDGLLQHHLDKHVKSLVTHTIQKDATHLGSHELLGFLQTNTHYSE